MALDQIWKQQLTLVTYGNEFLAQNLSFNRWLQHSIFNQHRFAFRDLMSQHLLAQHFQVWLEGLKQQGVRKLSLHHSNLLKDQQNPNPNVELLALPHFIVSHEANKKTAWIFGQELAAWYTADNDYEAPTAQQEQSRLETFWRFELNTKLAKLMDADLTQPNWDDIQSYTQDELFNSPHASGFQTTALKRPYDGQTIATNELDTQPNSLSLLPTDYPADYAHETLHRLDALENFIDAKIKHPYNAENEILSPEQQLDLRHFAQKIDDLKAKFIVKVANHYQSAQLTKKVSLDNPLEGARTEDRRPEQFKAQRPSGNTKVGASSVIKLIIMTVIICLVGYYFGL